MPGRILGVATAQSSGETIQFTYTSSSVSQTIFIATIPVFLTAVALRIRVGSTSGTVQVVKVPSGTAPASGTAITSALDISTTPTADTTITATLTQGVNNINTTLAPGDGLALVFAGTLTSGVGLVQLFIEPQT
jgi:hypothetical protein